MFLAIRIPVTVFEQTLMGIALYFAVVGSMHYMHLFTPPVTRCIQLMFGAIVFLC